MNIVKKMYGIFILTLILILGLIGCGGSDSSSSVSDEGGSENGTETSATSDEEVYKFNLGHIFNEEHAINEGVKKFEEILAEKTGNRVEIDIYPSSQIGGDPEMAEALQTGSLDMAVMNQGALSGLEPRLEIGNLMYLVDSYESADKLFYGDGVLATELNQYLDEMGIKNLEYFENDFRALTNNQRPVEKLEDMKGLSLRVPPTEMLTEFFTRLEALPTVIDFAELYTALQQGTVDGQDNGVLLTFGSKIHETQKYLTLLNHHYTSAGLVISKQVWETLPEDIQQSMEEAAVEASLYQRELNRSNVAEQIKTMEEEGIEITELAPEEMERFRELGIELSEILVDVVGQDVIDKVIEAANEISD